jgi:uncharacterized protein
VSRAGALLVLLLLAAGPLAAAAQEFPPLTGRVVDQARVLPPAVERELTDRLAAHEAATSNQVVVFTAPTLGGFEIADYGYRLGRHWGIGQEGRDNGALLIVATEDRQVRIEVGYGLEGDLPDATAKRIIENEILPAFRDGDYPGGIGAGVGAMLAAIDGAYEPLPAEPAAEPFDRDAFAYFALTVGFILFFIFTRFAARRDGRAGWRMGRRGVWVGGTTGGVLGGSGGFGGRGAGGFGGGGFGGGGGGFGGGGASGGW